MEGMNKVLNVVFDLDGVLIDSIDVQRTALYGSYKEVVGGEVMPSFDQFLTYTGNSLKNIFTKMGLPLEMIEPYRKISREAIDKINFNEEAFGMIRRLRKEGFRFAICTGKDRVRTIEILNLHRSMDLFEAIVCSDDVQDPKPSAVPVLRAIEKLGMGASPKNTVVVGDGYYDILSAHNAGCKAILTLWYGDSGVPREADYVVSSVSELEHILIRKPVI